MAKNFFDQFDAPAAQDKAEGNFFDQFDQAPAVEQPSGFGATKSVYGIGTSVENLQQQAAKTGAELVRYGLPVGVGIATGGLGFAPAAALGATAGATGEAIGEVMSGQELKPREIGAAGVAGLAAPLKTSKAILNFLQSTAVNLASSEGARYIQKGKFEAPKAETMDVLMRFGVPVGVAGLTATAGAKAIKAGEANAKLTELSRGERAPAPGSDIGSVALIDVLGPEYAKAEAGALKRGSIIARSIYDNIETPITEAVLREFVDSPSSKSIADKLVPELGALSQIRAAGASAKQEYDVLAARAEQATQQNRANAFSLKAQADEAATTAVKDKILYEKTVDKLLGGVEPSLGQLASGERMNTLKEIAAKANASSKSGISAIYDQVGLIPDDPVAKYSDVLANVQKAFPKDKVTRESLIYQIKKIAENPTVPLVDEAGNLSLSAYKIIRNNIAANLKLEGQDAKEANRFAGLAYDAIRSASDSFIQKNKPEVYDMWKTAQAASADFYNAKKASAIDYISEGNFNGLVDNILEEGAGPTLNELDAFTKYLYSVGDPASKAAAGRFFADTMGAVRDTLISKAAITDKGLDTALQMLDAKKLVGLLSTLNVKKFPIAELGLGSAKDVKDFAKIAGAATPGGITIGEFQKFLQDAPLGIDVAKARLDFARAAADFYVSKGLKAQANANRKLVDARNKAKLNSEEAAAILKNAEASPITQFLDNRNVKLSKNPDENADWIAKFITLDNSTIDDFFTSLKASGRSSDISDIKKAASSFIFRQFTSQLGQPKAKLNIASIADKFSGNTPADQRFVDTFKSIMGKEEFSRLKTRIIDPIVRANKTKATIIGSLPKDTNDIRDVISVGSALKGQIYTGYALGNQTRNALNMLNNGNYSLLYLLYVNPTTANQYAKSAYSIDKFVGNSAANGIALRLAMQEDAQNKANQPALPQQ
jgi:hypothetical protein